jgi:hypothetical protein
MTAMNLGTLRRALIRLGIYPSPTDVELKEAETDNLVVDRERVISQLAQHGADFKKRSNVLEAVTDKRKDDLSALLGHIKQINNSSASARTLIERLLSENRDGPFG